MDGSASDDPRRTNRQSAFGGMSSGSVLSIATEWTGSHWSYRLSFDVPANTTARPIGRAFTNATYLGDLFPFLGSDQWAQAFS